MRQDENKDLNELINMLEYMVPSHSLDMLTLIIIAAGNTEEGYCAIAYGKVEKMTAACQKVRDLDIFSLV